MEPAPAMIISVEMLAGVRQYQEHAARHVAAARSAECLDEARSAIGP